MAHFDGGTFEKPNLAPTETLGDFVDTIGNYLGAFGCDRSPRSGTQAAFFDLRSRAGRRLNIRGRTSPNPKAFLFDRELSCHGCIPGEVPAARTERRASAR